MKRQGKSKEELQERRQKHTDEMIELGKQLRLYSDTLMKPIKIPKEKIIKPVKIKKEKPIKPIKIPKVKIKKEIVYVPVNRVGTEEDRKIRKEKHKAELIQISKECVSNYYMKIKSN